MGDDGLLHKRKSDSILKYCRRNLIFQVTIWFGSRIITVAPLSVNAAVKCLISPFSPGPPRVCKPEMEAGELPRELGDDRGIYTKGQRSRAEGSSLQGGRGDDGRGVALRIRGFSET